ncbi:MAG: aminodeoxychorismate lyase [Pseudomonadota bacterium]|nr:aminodeoxychorismate lyase [Pseudomonadota bacterium]
MRAELLSGNAALVNGEIASSLSFRDRGLAYGDGVFETIRYQGTRAPLIGFHLDRLATGLARLGFPEATVPVVANDVQRLAGDLLPDDQVVLKVQVTRGAGARGYAWTTQSSPTRILSLSLAPELAAGTRLLAVRRCRQQLALQPALAGIKHLNRLEQVLARGEWQDEDIDEGILLDTHGCVVEAVASNLFWLAGGTVYTPDLSAAGVAGVMRRFVMEHLGAASIEVCEVRVGWEALQAAEAIWLTNAVRGVQPVGRLYDDSGTLCWKGGAHPRVMQLVEQVQSVYRA